MMEKKISPKYIVSKIQSRFRGFGEILQWFTAQLVNFVNGVKIVNFTKYEKLVRAALYASHGFSWPYWLKRTLSVCLSVRPTCVIINFLNSRDLKICLQ